MQEVLVEQGSDRAEVDNVARQGVVDRFAGKDVDLGMTAAAHHLQLAGLRDFAGEPHTPRAHDAPVHVELDEVRNVLTRIYRSFVNKAVNRLTIAIAVILQTAFAGLIADRAIERMIEQQILHDHPLMFLDLGAVRHEHRQVFGGRLAPGNKLGEQLDLTGFGILGADLDLAHAAVGNDRECRVPTIIRNVDPDRAEPSGLR